MSVKKKTKECYIEDNIYKEYCRNACNETLHVNRAELEFQILGAKLLKKKKLGGKKNVFKNIFFKKQKN